MPRENGYELLSERGYTSIVYRIPGTRKVCKKFIPDSIDKHFLVEKQAYERFTARGHPRCILRYYGVDANEPSGLILELAEKHSLYEILWDGKARGTMPDAWTLCHWARQAAEALAFAHSCGVLHRDIHCSNFLVDENRDLKVSDWGAAKIDGQKSWSSYRLNHQLFRPVHSHTLHKEISVESEIFALGSALYYMANGHDVFPELKQGRDDEEIIRRIRNSEFPDTTPLPVLGKVIQKCWCLGYSSMADVIDAIDDETLNVAGDIDQD